MKQKFEKYKEKFIEKFAVNFIKRYYMVLIAVLVLIITRIPSVFMELHGVNFDEAAIDYNIFCLSEYGVDRYGNAFPVYFANATSGQSALYVYIGVILAKLFGFSVTLGRVVKLIGEIVTVVLGGSLVKKIFGEKERLIFWGLYIISPYFYKMSGMAFDCDMIIPVFVMCMYFAYKCYENGKLSSYVALGISLGALQYSYIIAVLMIPLFILVQFFCGWNKKYVILETIIAFIVGFPIFWYLLTLIGVAPAITTDFITIAPVSLYRTRDVGFEWENILNLKYMIFTDSQADFAGSRTQGTVYYLTWIFVVIGVGNIISKVNGKKNSSNVKISRETEAEAKKYKMFGMLFMVAFVPMLFIKGGKSYHYTVLYFFIIAVASVGLSAMIKYFRLISVMVGVCYLIMFGVFMKEYLVPEPYIYGDDLFMDALDCIDMDSTEKVMLDTTTVFQPECYIGIKYKVNPKEITYNEYGRGTSIGNIYFNDADNYKDYDKIMIRNEIKYYYETTGKRGLTDAEAATLMKELEELNYKMEMVSGYCVYKK